MEDELARAHARGVSQYVVLGAGLDSFALRRPDTMPGLRVFEVDRPAMQVWKRRRIAELGLPEPSFLQYVPVNLDGGGLSASLDASGVNRDMPSFFSCLGLIQYLDAGSISKLLREVAGMSASGSEIVVQFLPHPDTLANDDAEMLGGFADAAARSGEPWLSLFEGCEMEKLLAVQGFRMMEHFDAAEASHRYLQDRADGLRAPAYLNMIKATRV